jgi:glycogen(starch) synthase
VKLLYWVPQFHPYIGGIEVLSGHYLQALVRAGHEPVVVTSHGALDLPDEDEWNGVRIHRLPFASALASGDAEQVVDVVARVRRLKATLRPDLVDLNVSDASGFFHLRTLSAHPCPSVVSLRVTVLDGAAGPLLGDLLRSADAVTGVSEASLRAVLAACPEAEPKARVILNALPPVDVRGLVAQPTVLVAAGRLVEDKGFDVAIRALAEVRQVHPTAVLRLAGDGPARADLERLAAELGVADAVELLGWVTPERLPAVLAEAAVVLMPSRWEEAFGLVALQGMQVGRPVVASAVGGLPEVVEDGVTGHLVPPEDPGALADAVAGLLEDPERAERLGAAGRARAESDFGFDRYVDEHLALYEELIGR